MDYKELTARYYNGKQVIAIIVVAISLIGMVIDTITYINVFPTSQLFFHFSSIGASLVALSLIFVDPKKYHKTAYLLCVYFILFTIVGTTILQGVVQAEGVDQTKIGLRDFFFLIIYMTISGFIISKTHIILQGLVLIFLILFYAFFLEDVFFADNFIVNTIAALGYIGVVYFLISTIQQFTKGLNQAILESETRQKANIRKTNKLETYQNTLLQLTAGDNLYRSDLNHLFSDICEFGRLSLKVDRVSIWLFKKGCTALEQRALSTMGKEGVIVNKLKKEDCADFFEAIQEKLFVAATLALENKKTESIKDLYLKPLNIFSQLSCLILIDGESYGVICCETQGRVNKWTTEDLLFVQSLADYIAIANKNQQIKGLINEIRKTNTSLELKVRDNIKMNEQLDALNKELLVVNEGLELAVRERTSSLQKQNEQLTEYAFINSHLLRAPIARILGLSNIIIREVKLERDQQLIEALEHTASELDDIVRKIGDILYDSNNLSRADIKNIISGKLIK